MYGLVDFLVGEHIIHMIGRKQAEEEARELAQPQQVSLLGRLVNRLPVLTPDCSFALEMPHEQTELNTAQCE